ncbi:hypothetical protein [Providencia sp. PROV119]|uniref:hypothetical protein n=1 Tax=Providencia sp. PROV119 TaxID=2949830 RepID=UPI0023495D6D|nr:hypothetical protein [Providencia sp. PROV119]
MTENKSKDYATLSHRNDGSSVLEIKKGTTRENTYYLHGEKAPHVYLEHHLCNQYSAYRLIEKDIRSILSWLKTMHEIISSEEFISRATTPEKMDLIKALFISSVTFYGKCFTRCEGRRIKLEEKNFVDEKYKEIHSSIMDIRHNLAAHSGKAGYEKARVALILHPRGLDIKPELFVEMMQANYITDKGDIENDEFYQLALSLQNKLIEKITILDEKILNEVVRPKGQEYWYTESEKVKNAQKLGTD